MFESIEEGVRWVRTNERGECGEGGKLALHKSASSGPQIFFIVRQ